LAPATDAGRALEVGVGAPTGPELAAGVHRRAAPDEPCRLVGLWGAFIWFPQLSRGNASKPGRRSYRGKKSGQGNVRLADHCSTRPHRSYLSKNEGRMTARFPCSQAGSE